MINASLVVIDQQYLPLYLATACQCTSTSTEDETSCYEQPLPLTQFRRGTSLCIFSTREILSIELLLVRKKSTSHTFIKDGEVIASDNGLLRSPSGIHVSGTWAKIDESLFDLPKWFFDTMDISSYGSAVGIAVIRSSSGGRAEVSRK